MSTGHMSSCSMAQHVTGNSEVHVGTEIRTSQILSNTIATELQELFSDSPEFTTFGSSFKRLVISFKVRSIEIVRDSCI
jgi:hypothetical protein